ncbi:MAG: hypothetical protein ACJ74I_08920 [Gaiellaceae bacterium]
MMFRWLLPAALAAGLAVLIVVSSGGAAPSPQAVTVANSSSHPVPVTVRSTAKVRVQSSAAGPVIVKETTTPFQQRVTATSSPGSEACQDIVVPAGRRLTIESFSAEIFTTAADPAGYILNVTKLNDPSNTMFFDRTVRLALAKHANLWEGHLSTLLFSGSTAGSKGATYSYRACVSASIVPAEMDGVVTGYLG